MESALYLWKFKKTVIIIFRHARLGELMNEVNEELHKTLLKIAWKQAAHNLRTKYGVPKHIIKRLKKMYGV